ncbi:MAG: hypothetical protein HQK51_03580, partial [Oligoflexia bacterium]|nr:hypothetical protein [Oligoflexia bacterium]
VVLKGILEQNPLDKNNLRIILADNSSGTDTCSTASTDKSLSSAASATTTKYDVMASLNFSFINKQLLNFYNEKRFDFCFTEDKTILLSCNSAKAQKIAVTEVKMMTVPQITWDTKENKHKLELNFKIISSDGKEKEFKMASYFSLSAGTSASTSGTEENILQNIGKNIIRFITLLNPKIADYVTEKSTDSVSTSSFDNKIAIPGITVVEALDADKAGDTINIFGTLN